MSLRKRKIQIDAPHKHDSHDVLATTTTIHRQHDCKTHNADDDFDSKFSPPVCDEFGEEVDYDDEIDYDVFDPPVGEDGDDDGDYDDYDPPVDVDENYDDHDAPAPAVIRRSAFRVIDEEECSPFETANNETTTTPLTTQARDSGNGAKSGGDNTIYEGERQGLAHSAGSKNKQPLYPINAFGSYAEVITLIANAVQVDPEMVGSALLGVTSALAQGVINVSSRTSDQGCPATVNVFVIAPSGERKSSTIDKIMKPVYAAINRANDQRRYMIVQDVTVDGLIVGLIGRCPSQFLLVLEGASLLGGHAMSRDNLSRFLGNVASTYSGEPLTRTRVDEHHYAQDRRLSVLLFTQPIVAMEFLGSELVMQQGMGNRFLYSEPSSLRGTRPHIDIELETESVYQRFCAKITALATHRWKINPETNGIDARTVRMSSGAKAAWIDFYNKMEFAVGPGGDLATHAGYVTRFPEQVMRIAALLAILEDPAVEHISEAVMRRAIELGEYYLDSALHVFNVSPANKDEADAKALLAWMQNKIHELDLKAIPVRMMYKDGPRCARPSKRTKELLAILVARGEVCPHAQTITYGDNKHSSDNYAVIDS